MKRVTRGSAEQGIGRSSVDRRTMLAGASALGLGITTSGVSTKAQAESGPKRGGYLRVGSGHGSSTDSLDPGTFVNGMLIMLGYTMHGYLTELTSEGTLAGEVAESWEPSADAATWTFRIREGIEFHDGRTVTAADVVASLDHHRGDDTKSAAKTILAPVVSINADGDRSVVVKLADGNADFPYLLADYHLAILPAGDDGKADWVSAVGCGAYKLDEFEPGLRIRLSRHANYWKPNRAWFDGGEIVSIADSAARQNALLSGEIDLMDRAELKTANMLSEMSGVRLTEVTGNQHYGFPMWLTTPPFDNADVRLALKYAVDREEMVDRILSGHGAVGNDIPLGPATLYRADDIPQREYDPDKARHHLKKAGMEGLQVDLHLANAAFPGAVDAGVIYSESAKAAGIGINVVREADDGYWASVWQKVPWCATYWGGRATADWMFSTAYACGASSNETNWCDQKFMDLLVSARSELDEQKRAEMYREMQVMMRDEGGIVIPMFANFVWGEAEKLQHGDQLSPQFEMDGCRAFERWWFA